MLDLAQSVFSFLFAIVVLVTVHEFGHFWVARKLGVKVLRFSVGFGKPLWMRRGADGTEYAIAAIPLGGYVRMFGEKDDGVDDTNRHLAFNHKPLAARAAIVAAGPALNFVFAIAAFWLIYTVGVPGIAAVIGGVAEGSAAARAGMKPDERITHVNTVDTPSWTAVNSALLDAALSDERITIDTRAASGAAGRYQLTFTDRAGLLDDNGVVANLGLRPWRPPVWIGETTPDGPAARAGLRPGDRVISADGRTIDNWSQWVGHIRARPGLPIVLEVERADGRVRLQVTPDAVIADGRTIGRIGVRGVIPDEVRRRHQVVTTYNPLQAAGRAVAETWDLSVLMLKMLGRMLTGEASPKNISGPVTIAQYAGLTAELGWLEFARFLALISVSLGVLNLLPIPMLDGGHLLYYCVEFLRGRPLSEQTLAVGQQIGVTLLFLLMGLAFYNDFHRLLG